MYIIAEIAQAHDGSLGIAHSYIDALAKIGVNAVKFQTHIAEAESSIYEPFRVNFSYEDTTRYDYWKRMEFTKEQWIGLKEHCEKVGVDFISSPFSVKAVELLENIGITQYKIGSGEVSNFLLLERIIQTKKPIILSSGMSSFKELDNTTNFLKKKNATYSILQATTAYPTKPQNYGLNVIQELKNRYKVKVGYSDHSAKVEVGIAAYTLGAEIFEFHAVFNKKMFGPDAKASLDLKQTKQLVKAIRNLEIAFKNPINKGNNEEFLELKNMFEKSLAVNQNLPKDSIVKFEHLESKKPKGFGINANEFEKVIGKKLKENKQKWDFLTDKDLC